MDQVAIADEQTKVKAEVSICERGIKNCYFSERCKKIQKERGEFCCFYDFEDEGDIDEGFGIDF